jgi:phosphoglycolate phosphatase
MPLVVFDLDGTLIDSRQDLADSINEMLDGFGALPLPAREVAAMVGDGAHELVERAIRRAGLDASVDGALGEFLAIYARRLVVHTRPYDGVVDAVRRAATRAALAVVTNKPVAPASRLLEAFGLAPCFRWVLGGDSPFPRKPDPAALRFLMREAGVSADETLFVGDSSLDVDTARRAGVRMCVARYGFGRERGDLVVGDDDLRVDDPAELAGTLDAWLEGGVGPRGSR